ncbi:MAG: DUF4823 domain-containing protein [Fibrobacteraceae bacterium]|nr:DUF4823 domain-containing protein [Fibrobacteraceae bacterium]
MKLFSRSLALMICGAALTFLSGCSASYDKTFLQPVQPLQGLKNILIITPQNGWFGETQYPTSGADVVNALTKQLKRYASSISVSEPQEITAIADEELAKYDYIFTAKILHWEDRLTGWSFRPDRIEVQFDIYNNQRELMNSILVKGKSANVVWVSKQPNSLLPKPIKMILEELF